MFVYYVILFQIKSVQNKLEPNILNSDGLFKIFEQN